MNSVQRFFRRYITSTIGILLLFFAVNIALLLGILTAGYMSGPEDDVSIQEIQAHLTLRNGIWTADEPWPSRCKKTTPGRCCWIKTVR